MINLHICRINKNFEIADKYFKFINIGQAYQNN